MSKEGNPHISLTGTNVPVKQTWAGYCEAIGLEFEDRRKLARENLKTSTGGANPQPFQNSEKAETINTTKELAKAIADASGVSQPTVLDAVGKFLPTETQPERVILPSNNRSPENRPPDNIRIPAPRNNRHLSDGKQLSGQKAGSFYR